MDAGPYSVVLADPPWRFRTWKGDKGARTAESFYSTMSHKELVALSPWLQQRITPQCALFLWCVSSNVPEAIALMNGWQFEFVNVAFVWVKVGKPYRPKDIKESRERGTVAVWLKQRMHRLHFGLGHYTRTGAEFCLLGVRGRLPRGARDVRQVIVAPVREHSRKPDEQYTRIERIFPDQQRLELFARHRRAGWHAWGDQLEESTG